MSSETFSPSLNVAYRGYVDKAQGFVPCRSTNEWSKELGGINRLAGFVATGQLGLMVDALGTSARIPVPAVEAMLAVPTNVTGTVSTGAMNVAALFTKALLANLQAAALRQVRAYEAPSVEHRGWEGIIDRDEYELRLAALSPGLANNEAEEHIPPPPKGEIQGIPLG